MAYTFQLLSRCIVYGMKTYALFLFLLLAPGLLHSQTPSNDTMKTNNQLNGRFWRPLNDTAKIHFLAGYWVALDAVSMTNSDGSFEKYKTGLKVFYPAKLTATEVFKALDMFYETPENGPIAICFALSFISSRSEGNLSEEVLQERLRSLRKDR